MKRFNKFVQLTKIDPVNRTVEGIAAVEELDKTGEIFDYSSSKPYFDIWSADFQKMTLPAVQIFGESAKSYGNVREMHGKVAAGKLNEPLIWNDVQKSLRVVAKVTDEEAWKKVETGTYTGFSIGGQYLKIWDDTSVKYGKGWAKRYTATPIEISLVDNPCMPSATFEVLRSGQSEMRKFATLTAEEISEKLTGVASGLAAGDKDAHSAAAHYVKAARVAQVDVSGFIKAYFELFPVKPLSDAVLGKLDKSLWDVMDLASDLMSLNWCQICLADEAAWEGDGSTIPYRLRQVVETISAILVDLVIEETSELITPSAKLAATAGAEVEKEIQHMKKFFDLHTTALNKAAASEDPDIKAFALALQAKQAKFAAVSAAYDAFTKAFGEALDADQVPTVTKAADPVIAELQAGQLALGKSVETIVEVMKSFMGQPASAKTALNSSAVNKDADNGIKAPAAIDPKDPDAMLKAMKLAQSQPIAI